MSGRKRGAFVSIRGKQNLRMRFPAARPRFVSLAKRCPRCIGCLVLECTDTMRCLSCGHRVFAGRYTGQRTGIEYVEQHPMVECGAGRRSRYASGE